MQEPAAESGAWSLGAEPTAVPAPTGRSVRRKFFWRTLREHKLLAVWIVVVSVALSVVPAAKSVLESAVISAINKSLQVDGFTFRDALDQPVDQLGEASDAGNVIERVVVNAATVPFANAPLWGALLWYAAITLLAALLAWASTASRARLSRSFYTRLRRHGMRTLMSPKLLLERETPHTDSHGTTVQQGALNISSGYAGMIQAGQFALAIATTTWFVVSRNGLMALAIWVIVASHIGLMWFKTRRLARDRQALEESSDDVVRRSDDIIANRDMIAAHEQEARYGEKLDGLAEQFGAVEQRLTRRDQSFRSFAGVLSDYGRMAILLAALAVAAGAYGSGVTDIGDAYFLIAVYLRIITPAQGLLDNWDDYRQSRDTSTRFRYLLVETPEERPTGDEAAVDDDPAVRFEDVHFSYPSSDGPQPALSGCTFTLPKGKASLIVGRSGSGKTTIARMILGFIQPEHGNVVVQGRELGDWAHGALMEQVSYATQTDHVLADTVRANLFCEGRDDADLARALQQVNMPHASASAEEALALLDLKAHKLSAGQQQRVALARLLLDEDPIVLMDEPLSGVDAFTFRDVSPAIGSLLKDSERTAVMISHRLAFAAQVEHVIVLDRGRVIEQGSRDALLANTEGEFRQLWQTAVDQLVPSQRVW